MRSACFRITGRGDKQQQARASLQASLGRVLLDDPDRPLILAIARADAKKNLAGLIEAYGVDRELHNMGADRAPEGAWRE
jgi:hypothetical protein